MINAISQQDTRVNDRRSRKPVIRGTRIPVEVILEYLAHNPDFDDLFADYPRLTMDDIKAAFAYAQHLVQIEATLTA